MLSSTGDLQNYGRLRYDREDSTELRSRERRKYKRKGKKAMERGF
jgi:hypothetical protein